MSLEEETNIVRDMLTRRINELVKELDAKQEHRIRLQDHLVAAEHDAQVIEDRLASYYDIISEWEE